MSCKVSEAERRASLTLQETRNIHDSMNIPKIEKESGCMRKKTYKQKLCNRESDLEAFFLQEQSDLGPHCLP